MDSESHSGWPDRVIAALAGRHHGVVARPQLLEAGLTPRQISVRLASGRLHAVHRGVYLVGHSVSTEHGRDMAALPAPALMRSSATGARQRSGTCFTTQLQRRPALRCRLGGMSRGLGLRFIAPRHPDRMSAGARECPRPARRGRSST